MLKLTITVSDNFQTEKWSLFSLTLFYYIISENARCNYSCICVTHVLLISFHKHVALLIEGDAN